MPLCCLQGMTGAIRKAEELVASTPGAYMLQQFDNPANPEVCVWWGVGGVGGVTVCQACLLGWMSGSRLHAAAFNNPANPKLGWVAVWVGRFDTGAGVLAPACFACSPRPSCSCARCSYINVSSLHACRCTTRQQGLRSGATQLAQWTFWWRGWALAAPSQVKALE